MIKKGVTHDRSFCYIKIKLGVVWCGTTCKQSAATPSKCIIFYNRIWSVLFCFFCRDMPIITLFNLLKNDTSHIL